MRFTAALVVVSLIAAACAADNPQQTDDPPSTAPGTVAGMLVASDLDRLDPSASSADVERVTTGLAEFAADLYVQLADDGNMVFSPVSVYTALAMAYAGAVGSTADEMAELLAGGVERDEFQAAMNVLDQTLESRNRSASEFEGAVELSIANSLWGQDGMAFEQAFLDALATNYGSGMRIVDFIDGTAREEARLAINAWVAGETNDRIEDLIAAGVLDAMVRLVLVNAVYLNAAWATPFEEAATADQRFTLLNGDDVSVPMMHQAVTLPYVEGEGWQAIRIPYAGNGLGMLVILPDEGSFEQVEASLADGFLDVVSRALSSNAVVLSLPKFEIRTQTRLVPPLQSMGLREATSDAADFSGMTGARDLFISDVVHEAWISADEAGTEAAAATAVIMSLTAAPQDPVLFSVDRPFIFVLQDIETESILFMGRVVDPSS